jgi:hypothetical protein
VVIDARRHLAWKEDWYLIARVSPELRAQLLSFAEYSDTQWDCHSERSEESAFPRVQEQQIPRAKSGRSE